MFTLLHELRIGLRFLARNRAFAVASAVILALGISLSATLFAIVKGALIEPWPYHGYDRLVTVRATYPTQGRSAFSLWSVPEIEDLRGASDVFAHVIAGDARNVNLTYLGHAERVRAAVITPNAFGMLGVPAFLGRGLNDADVRPAAAPVVVVSFRFWQTRLGADRGVIGRTLRIADVPYEIAGVMPESFVFWGRDLWMPLALDRAQARRDRRYYVQAQLQPQIAVDAAESRLRVLAARLAADHPGAAGIRRPRRRSQPAGGRRAARSAADALSAAGRRGARAAGRDRQPGERDARARHGARGRTGHPARDRRLRRPACATAPRRERAAWCGRWRARRDGRRLSAAGIARPDSVRLRARGSPRRPRLAHRRRRDGVRGRVWIADGRRAGAARRGRGSTGSC